MPEFTDAQVLEILDWLLNQEEFGNLSHYSIVTDSYGNVPVWQVQVSVSNTLKTVTASTRREAILEAAKVLRCPAL